MSLELIQIGMNTSDHPATLELFTEAFGFRNAGGQVILGDLIQIQGLDSTAHAMMWWLVGAQSRFQLEFFRHTRPAQRPLPDDWRPCDLGWSRFGIAVERFDHAVAEMARRDIVPIAGIGMVQGLRRCAYRDPFIGVIVEVMEDGPALRARTGRRVGPALVYAAASVSDLSAATHFYTDILGLRRAHDHPLHDAGSDALWGMTDARSKAVLIDAGPVLLEIVQYLDPVGRPRRADYSTADQGVVNVALGAREKAPIESAFARLAAAGYHPPHRVEVGDMLAGYILDAEREVELAVIPEALEAVLGFTPASPFLGAGG